MDMAARGNGLAATVQIALTAVCIFDSFWCFWDPFFFTRDFSHFLCFVVVCGGWCSEAHLDDWVQRALIHRWRRDRYTDDCHIMPYNMHMVSCDYPVPFSKVSAGGNLES